MRLRHLALPAAAGLTLLAVPFAPAASAAPAACDPALRSCVVTFASTGGPQTFQVPAGVTVLRTLIGGASGGDGLAAIADESKGGRGGVVEALVPVTPGETLDVVVGGRGADASPDATTPAAGGYGGGGAGTVGALGGSLAGGGGGSFLFDSTGALLLAVGGGGGAGLQGIADRPPDGGAGGAVGGTAGVGTNGGGGATPSAGGTAGQGTGGAAGTGPATGPAVFGTGGSSSGTCSAGGGGGGYFGGGSGGCTAAGALAIPATARAAAVVVFTIGGGGGGAGFAGPGVSPVAGSGGVNPLRDGVVAFQYTAPATTTTTLTTSRSTLAPGQEADLSATVTGPTLTSVADAGPAEARQLADAAFGAQATQAAAAGPPPGSTVTPGTACGATPCTVTFFVNGAQLGTPIAVDAATGTATVVFTAGSELGVRTVTARYDGNAYYLPSTSAPAVLTVSGLAATGPHAVTPLIGAAAGLLLVGTGLLGLGRRRPTRDGHQAV